MYFLIVTVCIILIFVFMICLRRNLMKKAFKLDYESTTPSDYCVIGKGLKFDHDKHSPAAIQEHLTKYF